MLEGPGTGRRASKTASRRAAAGRVRAVRMEGREKGWLHLEKMGRKAMEVGSLSNSEACGRRARVRALGSCMFSIPCLLFYFYVQIYLSKGG